MESCISKKAPGQLQMPAQMQIHWWDKRLEQQPALRCLPTPIKIGPFILLILTTTTRAGLFTIRLTNLNFGPVTLNGSQYQAAATSASGVARHLFPPDVLVRQLVPISHDCKCWARRRRIALRRPWVNGRLTMKGFPYSLSKAVTLPSARLPFVKVEVTLAE